MKNINLMNYDAVIILAPHPDDEILGCFSIIDKYKEKVTIAYVTDGCFYDYPKVRSKAAREIRQKELEKVCNTLKIDYAYFGLKDTHVKENLTEFSMKVKDLVNLKNLAGKKVAWFIPHLSENHEDHIFTNIHFVHTKHFDYTTEERKDWKIFKYEVWRPMSYPNYFSEVNCIEKAKTMELYKSQLEKVPYVSGITGLNRYRGLQLLKDGFYEVFE